MPMIPFLEEEIECLAVELPDLLKFYAYSGDFDAEIREIDRILREDSLPPALRSRLRLERVIAEGMKEEYTFTFEELLSRIKEKFPKAEQETLLAIVKRGHADYILKKGEFLFQRAAYSNILKTCTRYLESMKADGSLGTPPPLLDEGQHQNAAVLQEKGYRAFSHTVSFSVEIKENAIPEGETVTVHIPYPAPCEAQREIELLSSSHPVFLSESKHRTASITTPYRPGETYSVTYRYTNIARYHALDAEKVRPNPLREYLGEELPHIRFTPYLISLAEMLRGNETNPLRIAKRIYDYITAEIKYSYMRSYLFLPNIPEFAALNRRGDCGVQALLFITLCRISGVPARWQSGCTAKSTGIGSHDWAEMYLEPYGWLPVDPSFGGGAYRRGDGEMREFYFGNLDPFRLVTCTDFQIPFDPPKRYMRTDPYDNQSGEVECESKGLSHAEFTTTRTVLDSKEL